MEKHPIIFFDGYCGLCNGFVDFVMERDKKKIFRFATLQGKTAARLLPKEDYENIDSVVLVMDDFTYKKSKAVLKVFSVLGGGWQALSVFDVLPLFLKNFGYDLVAKYRYALFGKREVCRMPTREERALFLD
jgi:predicted DCC family thiol-disulfide oxidoreductase YuxK